MGLLAQLFGLPSLTLAATIESLVIIKFHGNDFARLLGSNNHLAPVAIVFLANYAFAAFFWGFLYPNFLSPLRRLPGPRSYFSVAHRTLLVTDKAPGDIFLDLVKQYPGEELLNLNAYDTQLLMAKPRLLADLLVHRSYEFIKPTKISGFLRHVLGDGLVVVEGDQHKFLRKNTMPAFSFRHIKNLYPMMWKKAVLMTEGLQNEVSSGDKKGSSVIEITPWASKVTLDIIGVAGMGRDFNMLEKSEDPILSVYEELLEPHPEKLAFAMSCFLFGRNLIKLIPWRMNNLFDYLTGRLNELYMPMLQEKREAIQKKDDDHFDVLSLLIKSNNFSDPQLKDQLLTFLAAGHETTASSLTWACYLLAKHPDIQERLRAEIEEALPSNVIDDSVDLAGILDQLPLLNGIINETLRLYPTVPMTMRTATRDTHLGEQPIPKGTTIVLSMWQMNRSPEVWGPEAAEFLPERWITDTGKPNQNGGANSNYEFLTFLHGPRSCIGQGFARAEMRCLLANLIRIFSWDLAMDEKEILPRGVITIKPANGMYLNLKVLPQD